MPQLVDPYFELLGSHSTSSVIVFKINGKSNITTMNITKTTQV